MILESVVASLIKLPREVAQMGTDMREGFERVDRRIDGVELELRNFQEVVITHFMQLEKRMDEGFREARTLTRVLYEDLISRIATIGEGRP